MEIREMSFEDIEARKSELMNQLEERAEGINLEAIDAEISALEERKEELKAEAETRAMEEQKALEVVEVKSNFEIEESKEETRMFGIETKEYRDAFFANLVGGANEEQRAILADNSAYGDGLALPVGTDTAIWDQVTTAHPILGDITKVAAGMPIKVTRMTPAAVTKKKDSGNSSEQTFTSLEVTLVGADYHTYVTLSYAEAKMSQGAMEAFLVSEIAGALGEALAKDVFARILSDCGTGQKVTPDSTTPDLFGDVKKALGLATQAVRPVIYAPADKYYEIVGAIKSGVPFNMGATLGCEVKLDTAATKVTVVDPTAFVLDEIQSTIIESERDAKNAQYVIGGYMRAEGCLRKTKAAAYIN